MKDNKIGLKKNKNVSWGYWNVHMGNMEWGLMLVRGSMLVGDRGGTCTGKME